MSSIFTTYADNAFQVGEGLAGPPKPEKTLKELFSDAETLSIRTILQGVIRNFIKQHFVRSPSKQDLETEFDRFEELYDLGVFRFRMLVFNENCQPVDGAIFVDVWDGEEYVDANEFHKDSK